MLKFERIHTIRRLSLASLALTLVFGLFLGGCEYSGAFDGKRCSKQSDCAGASECVDGYCVSTDLGDVGTPLVAQITIAPNSLNVRPGDTTQLNTTTKDADGAPVAVDSLQWASTNEAVATVDGDGVVTAVAPGTAVITARADSAVGTAAVTVSEVPAASVKIEPQTLALKVGGGDTLTATVLDADDAELSGRPVTWSSDTPSVAVVDDSGQVTAIGIGEATITATSGDAKGTAGVTVSAADAASVELTPTSVKLVEGDQFTLTALVRDTNQQLTDALPITWTSSDDTIATVDANGVVSAVKTGSATITASVGAQSASCDVSVIPTQVASIDLSPRSAVLQTGDTKTLSAQALAADGSALSWPTITWTSSDDTIATVDANGTVDAVQAGTVAITAEAGGVERSAAITVIDRQATGLTIAPTSATIEAGQTDTFTATVTDANGQTLSSPVVVWTSSDNGVAVVDANGEVLGVDAGPSGSATATITATTAAGISDSATVTVNRRSANAIALKPASASLQVTQTLELAATVRAGDGTVLEGRTVSYTSSNDAIASVDANGTVTANAVGGPVTITATSGSAQATADITVVPRSVSTVEVSPQLDSVIVGATVSLTATAHAADGTALSGRTASWSSDDPSVATVDSSGVVTGVSSGMTLVRATIDGQVGFASVRVDPKPASTVTINEGNQSVSTGASVQLTATVKAADGSVLTNRIVQWKSMNNTVAVVDAGGNVTGLSGGTATITATCGGASDSVTVTVTASNSAPTATAQSQSTAEDTSLSLTLAGTDPNSDPLTFAIDALPQHGQLTGLNASTGAVTYTPDANYNGADSFSFSVTDPSGASSTAGVSLTVTAVNDAPVANDDAATTAEDTNATIDVLGNDTDVDGDSLNASIGTQPAHGTATLNANGTITYQPNANYNGADSFTYSASDGTLSSTATVRVTVTAANDAPVANDDTVSVDEDHSLVTYPLANDTDVDGDALSVASSSVSTPAHGTTTLNADGTVTYTPDANYFGSDSFTYQATDGSLTASATVNITVNAVNDPPTAASDSGSVAEGGATDIDVLANDTDIDSMSLSVASIEVQPVHATASINANGTIHIVSNDNYNGTDYLVYTVSDGNGGTDSTWVTFTITPVNDPPVADAGGNQTVTTGATVQLDASASYDVDGDALSYTWSFVSKPAPSSASFSDPNFIAPTFVADKAGQYVIQLTVDDGTTTTSVQITISA